MSVLWIALVAGAAMYVQDLLATTMVQAEARNRAYLAGSLDALGWLATITTTTVSVTTLQGNDFTAKALVVVIVTAANFFGTAHGVKIGARHIKEAS